MVDVSNARVDKSAKQAPKRNRSAQQDSVFYEAWYHKPLPDDFGLPVTERSGQLLTDPPPAHGVERDLVVPREAVLKAMEAPELHARQGDS